MRVNCQDAAHGGEGLAVSVTANALELSNQKGVSLSCDLLHQVCSFTLDGWLHGGSSLHGPR